jgi:hypothetical protein
MSHLSRLHRRRSRHRAGAGGVGGPVRLAVVLWSAVVVQAYVVETIGSAGLRSLDLPLVAVTMLILARPGSSATVALVGGFLVDAFGRRLFGIHVVAYAAIGPVLQMVPLGPRRGTPAAVATASAAGLASAVAVAVVALGQTVADGGIPAGTGIRLLGAVAWTAIPAAALAGPAARRFAPLAA